MYFYIVGLLINCTYHCRSVNMRLYSIHKREFVMVIVAFFACFGLAVFIGLAGESKSLPYFNNFEIFAISCDLLSIQNTIILITMIFTGPPITSTSEQKAHLNASDMATGPFIMNTPALSTYSQQLWVIAKLSTSNNDGTKYSSISLKSH